MPWWDFYKLWTYSFEEDPQTKMNRNRELVGAGVSLPEAIPNIRQDGSYWGGGKGLIRLRDTNDMIDLSTVSNRQSRYKEYERLRNVAEIESVMTVLADESCLDGSTKVATLYDGYKSLRWLAENKQGEEFLVYCWDFDKNDYSLGWAYDPRMVKKSMTVRIRLDDGSFFISTIDHRVLLKNGEWSFAGQLKQGDELMPFYKIKANSELSKQKRKQFPRIYTNANGWVHERQFIDEWRTGKADKKFERVNQACRILANGISVRKTAEMMDSYWGTINQWLKNEGFGSQELKVLGKKSDSRRVIGIFPHKEIDVYDLSVKDHENFCGESVIFHNCQRNEENHVFELTVANEEVKEELEFMFFHRKMLNFDRKMWQWAKKLYIYGDLFLELVMNPESPKDGILRVQELPPDSVFKIETTKGKLIEYQQSPEGPDYQSLTRAPVPQATEADLQQSKALRFSPDQIVHFKIGDDRKTFYPYGQSLIEPARGPAHQLRLMEDAMVVYRLTRAPERRVFYIDVGQLPPFKAEAFMERIKDQFRKKKVSAGKGGEGANAVEERWHAPAADEDYWLPIRPNSNTRIDTLPGAQNLGEIDDAVYFRNKLYTALNFPKNYFSNEDPGATRITLSAQDVKFARMIERLQSNMEDGLWEIADRHLRLRGFPEESYEDLQIKLTPPSDWKELSGAEVITNRINNANGLKGSMLMSDYDILTRWMKYNEEDAQRMMARMKLQKLEDLKLQIIAQNPQLLGVGVPGQSETEMGAQAGGPSPMVAPGGELPAGGEPPVGGEAPAGGEAPTPPAAAPVAALADATPEEVKKFDLEIQTYASEQDREDIDFSLDD